MGKNAAGIFDTAKAKNLCIVELSNDFLTKDGLKRPRQIGQVIFLSSHKNNKGMNHSLKLKILFAATIAFLVVSLLSSISSKAADLHQTIRGEITDQDSKNPVIGANLVVLNSDPILGSSTDAKGEFRIEKVAVGRVSLKITCIGYEKKIIPNLLISSAKEFLLNIDMVESMMKMDELVIIANRQNKGTSINSFWNTNTGIFFRYKVPKTEFSIAK